MSVITGDAVLAACDMDNKEVVEECMKVLRELFKEQVILSRLSHTFSHIFSASKIN